MSSSAGPEVHHISWNPKVHDRVTTTHHWRSSFFWDVTEHRLFRYNLLVPYSRVLAFSVTQRTVVVTDLSGEPIGRSFNGDTDVFGPISRFRLKNGPIGYPETSVTTNLRCVTLQKSKYSIYIASEAWNQARLLLLAILKQVNSAHTRLLRSVVILHWWLSVVDNCHWRYEGPDGE